MDISAGELQQRMEGFRNGLKQAGVRLTHQRLEIFQELAKAADHPDAETLFRRVRERLPTISLDTVYRALWLFLDLGLITTLGPSRAGTRFDANMSSHHHFVCSQCGMTLDFYSEEFDKLKIPQRAESYGQAHTTHVEVRGVCLECLDKEAAKATDPERKEETS